MRSRWDRSTRSLRSWVARRPLPASSRAERGAACGERVIQGAQDVAEQILRHGSRLAPLGRPALVNGAAAAVVIAGGRPRAVAGFTVADGKIVEIDLLSDPVRLRELDLGGLEG